MKRRVVIEANDLAAGRHVQRRDRVAVVLGAPGFWVEAMLTPEGARELGEHLIETADFVQGPRPVA